ncbi:DoxX family protein [Flavitalea flava]
MGTIKEVLTFLLGMGMILAGIMHFRKTRMYLRIIPEFFPLRIPIVLVSGVLELVTGAGLFIPVYRQHAAQLILIMMIGFLPLHIWDIFREKPAMGTRKLALIRLPLQFLLIAWAWFIGF